MKIFKLPDLGEGLPDAIVREWYVKEDDHVEMDQPLVAMETAKALVDVPSPYAGKIVKLFGQVGDTIETGKPLIGFEGEPEKEQKSADKGTVVGAIEEGSTILKETATGIATSTTAGERIKATPAVRALAKKLGVDLSKISAKGERITAEDVQAAANKQPSIETQDTYKLSPVRRAMMMSMSHSHQEVAPVTLVDDADINAWNEKQDPTIRLIRAIAKACTAEPILNAYFDSRNLSYQHNEIVNIGIAVDTEHGLYVPVIKDVNNLDDAAIRNKINQFKTEAKEKSIAAENLHGATIMFTNFGVIAGRYATPILLPPMVAIIGVGRARDEVVAVNKQPAVHRLLPLSVTIDHRLVTGGEAARFLRVLLDELSKASL